MLQITYIWLTKDLRLFFYEKQTKNNTKEIPRRRIILDTAFEMYSLISGISNSCQPSEYCDLNHQVCLPKCTSNRDCEDGYKCSEGKCLKYCANSNQCPSNTYCHK